MKAKGKILYISYDGMTDQLGQSQVLPYLTGLSARGYAITLLSCEKPLNYAKNKAIIEAICRDAGINWQPTDYTAKPPIVSTIKDLRALRQQALALHARHKFDVIHCRSYIAALVGLHMKRHYGTRFLFDMRGFWADERVDGELWNLKHPVFRLVYNYFKKKELQFLQEADHIISLTHAAEQEIRQWTQVKKANLPISVIPCCVDTQLFDPARVVEEAKASLRRRLGIDNHTLVIGYVGAIGTWYLLNEMLEYFKVAKRLQPDSKLMFVTLEPAESIVEQAKVIGIEPEHIVVISAQRKEMPLYISILDQGLFFIKPSYSKKASSPTKQGEIMAMGVPVVCNAGVGDTERVVRQYRSGVVVDAFTEDAYGKAFVQSVAGFDRNGIRKGAIEFYGLEKGVDAYERVYRLLLNRKDYAQ